MIRTELPSESLKEFHKCTGPHIDFKGNTFISPLFVCAMKSDKERLTNLFSYQKLLADASLI